MVSTGNSGGVWFGGAPYATVSPTGVVTAGSVTGTAVIGYFVSNTCGSDFTTISINITAGVTAGTIIGSSPVCAGSYTSIFTSTGTTGGTWASSDPTVASVAFSPSVGLFYAQKAGTTTISYTVAPGACSAGPLVSYFTLTVNPAGNAGTITAPAPIRVVSVQEHHCN